MGLLERLKGGAAHGEGAHRINLHDWGMGHPNTHHTAMTAWEAGKEVDEAATH
jgi:hypothetical protein